MIILITASLSSNTYNKASWWEEWTFENHWSLFEIAGVCESCEVLNELHVCSSTSRPVLSWFWVVLPRTETIRSHRSRTGTPSNPNPASNEMISDSVELWETAVCFLHIQLIGTNVWLPKTHNVPPEVDFESSRSPAESWKSPSLHCLAVLHTWQYCLYSHVWGI